MRETLCIFFAISHWLKYRGCPDSIPSSRGWNRYKRLIGLWGFWPVFHDTWLTILHAVGIHRFFDWSNDQQRYVGYWKLGKPQLTFLFR